MRDVALGNQPQSRRGSRASRRRCRGRRRRTREGRKTAIRPGDHALPADDAGEAAKALADQFRVFDEVRVRIDHARYEEAIIGDGHVGQRPPLVAVPGVGRLEQQRADVRAERDRQHYRQWRIVVVRPFVVAPAHMQSHTFRRDALRRVVERVHVQFGEHPVFRVGLVLEHHVATETEVGRIASRLR